MSMELNTIKLLSWNILHGGGKRCPQILDAIAAERPDIVTLQEFRSGSNSDAMKQGLTEMGLTHQYIPTTASKRDNTVIVASQFPFDASEFPRTSTNENGAHIIQADFDEPELTLFGAHLPHKRKQLPYFDALLNLPDSYTNHASLILGDLNCGIPFEDSETKSFYATHLFQQLLRQGWIDAWRSRHPNSKTFSWISTKHQNGFRYDHALASMLFNQGISSIEYRHDVRLAGVSDHSMLVIEYAHPMQ